eukprot:CAMPEP_0170999392 /NCGR_PEP_ID=MMETSP0736-20130129/14078_1 /TAXON_ID=186038 /ORGANISM="Fragilariopsis kerguelensis, Strain L26-C5" /LENGTH=93 /DNA_ID=CAMNT_0011426565 /DNA_START=5 /DNA_END=282 /DNA_ORIENTATION=-
MKFVSSTTTLLFAGLAATTFAQSETTTNDAITAAVDGVVSEEQTQRKLPGKLPRPIIIPTGKPGKGKGSYPNYGAGYGSGGYGGGGYGGGGYG